MKRFLMVLALAGAMIGCGDDDGDDDSPDAGPDASVDAGGLDARVDGGGDAAVAAKVTNVGVLCTANSGCMPAGATCDTMTQFGATTPGFCSASCTKAAECGSTGDCPVGELVTGMYGAAFKMNGFPNVTTGQCYAKCTTIGQQSTCAAGFVCSNVKTAFGMPDTANIAPEVLRPVCIPMGGLVPRGDGGTPSPDGGVRNDAGPNTVADAGGMDSGT